MLFQYCLFIIVLVALGLILNKISNQYVYCFFEATDVAAFSFAFVTSDFNWSFSARCLNKLYINGIKLCFRSAFSLYKCKKKTP